MKTKTQTKFGLKQVCYAFLAVFLTFSIASVQFSLFQNNFKQLSFEASSIVLEQGEFQETRITTDGNIIQRFFTGLKELPFVDYLVVNNTQGESFFIPLRNETQHLQQQNPALEAASLFKESALIEKNNILEKTFSNTVFILAVLAFILTAKAGFLIFATLSREKLWIMHQSLLE